MNSGVKIGVSIAVVAVVAAGGIGFMAKNVSDSIKDGLDSSVAQLKLDLPKDSVVENTVNNSGLFTTEGSYKILVPNEDKELSGGVVVNYTINHGLGSIFGGEVTVDGNVKPEGEVIKTVSLKVPEGVSQSFHGTIENGQSLNIDITHNPISLHIPEKYLSGDENGKGVTITANGQKDNLKYDLKTNEVEWSYTGLNVNIDDVGAPADKILAKNLSGKYNVDMKKNSYGTPFQGKVSFKAGEIVSGNNELVVKDLSINTDSNVANKKYNMNVDTKVGSVSGFGQNNLSGELSFSISDINTDTVTLFSKVKKTISKGSEISNTERDEIRNVLTADLLDGFTVSINKLYFKNDKNDINLSLKVGVTPTMPDTKFSLYKNGLLDAALSVKGDLAIPASAIIGTSLGMPPMNPANPTQEFVVTAKYKEGVLTVNEATAKPDVLEIFTNGVKAADGELGFEVVDVTPVTVQEEKIEVVPEQKTVTEATSAAPTEQKNVVPEQKQETANAETKKEVPNAAADKATSGK